MKIKALVTLSCLLLLCSSATAEERTYKLATKDYKVDNILDVEVTEETILTMAFNWTMREIDSYIVRCVAEIEAHKDNIEALEAYMEELTELRKEVEKEAKKAKLRMGNNLWNLESSID